MPERTVQVTSADEHGTKVNQNRRTGNDGKADCPSAIGKHCIENVKLESHQESHCKSCNQQSGNDHPSPQGHASMKHADTEGRKSESHSHLWRKQDQNSAKSDTEKYVRKD